MTPPEGQARSRFVTLFFIACFLLVLYFLVVILLPFFSTFLWAGLLTVIFLPLYRWILRSFRGHRALASLVTCLLVLLMIVIPVIYLSVSITQQSVAVYQKISASVGDGAGDKLDAVEQQPAVQWVLDQVGRITGTGRPRLRPSIEQMVTNVSRFLVSRAPSLLKGVGEFLFTFLLIFISMFFFFRDGPQLLETIKVSNPLPEAYETEIIRKFQDVSYAAFFGSILTALVQGLAGALLFWILRIPSPLFWGAVIAFVSLVPIVGAFLVWIPWSAYLLLSGETGKGVALLAVGGLVVSSIDNILKPIIIRGRTDMHPLLVFLSVLGGMQAFGFLGILVGPLVAALFLSFLEFYRKEFREPLERKRGKDSGLRTQDSE